MVTVVSTTRAQRCDYLYEIEDEGHGHGQNGHDDEEDDDYGDEYDDDDTPDDDMEQEMKPLCSSIDIDSDSDSGVNIRKNRMGFDDDNDEGRDVPSSSSSITWWLWFNKNSSNDVQRSILWAFGYYDRRKRQRSRTSRRRRDHHQDDDKDDNFAIYSNNSNNNTSSSSLKDRLQQRKSRRQKLLLLGLVVVFITIVVIVILFVAAVTVDKKNNNNNKDDAHVQSPTTTTSTTTDVVPTTTTPPPTTTTLSSSTSTSTSTSNSHPAETKTTTSPPTALPTTTTQSPTSTPTITTTCTPTSAPTTINPMMNDEYQDDSRYRGRRLPGQLRFDWSNLKPKSIIAKELVEQRHNCELPLVYHEFGTGGLGAELHAYTFSMCLAHKFNVRLYSQHFMYRDNDVCDNKCSNQLTAQDLLSRETLQYSSLSCYFTQLELQCGPKDIQSVYEQQVLTDRHTRKKKYYLDYWNIWKDKTTDICDSIMSRDGYKDRYSNIDMRSAAIEAIFTSKLSSIIINEAKRQHYLVFTRSKLQHAAGDNRDSNNNNSSSATIDNNDNTQQQQASSSSSSSNYFVPSPNQLITVHIRWGDKGSEMELVPIMDYIHAVQDIVTQQNIPNNETYIYLATEDPRALQQFQNNMNVEWTLYIDQFYVDMLPHRNNATQEVAGVAKKGYGHVGILALGSLLVSMEANHFVLTSASNWSRLINELRRNIIRPRCSNNDDEGGVVDINSSSNNNSSGTTTADDDYDYYDCTSAIDLRKADFWMDLDAEGNGV